ncbi:MAG: iron ABC transporter permease, partial [Casimicrobiaceae bacterium]
MAIATGVRGRAEDYVLLWGLVGIVALLSMLPLARLLLEAFVASGVFSLDAVRRVLGSRLTWTATGHSLVIAVGGTLLATV